MGKMKNPAHPGKIIKHSIQASDMSVTDAATHLGITRQTLSRLINLKCSLSPEMAIRVSKAFGSTPEHWLRIQMSYDLAHMQDKIDNIMIQPIPDPYENHPQ